MEVHALTVTVITRAIVLVQLIMKELRALMQSMTVALIHV
jgi:hypothetical protein